ncbi:sensor histidine kinase [Streptomyces bathyalis]|uniref:histidine kinase n=1 Tax=Streptomyces bathyalis TaxID=2710756 RepID=A0A7T1T561_9ACTN|nr:sensor histidine kinase [Streptomyces bathyalis]QPP06570.1 sensor histidine kinase [Streptomyces bathyalis]
MNRLRWTDWVLAAGMFTLLSVQILIVGPDTGQTSMWPWGWTLTAVASWALLFRRLMPRTVLAVTAVAGLLYYPLGYPDTFLGFTFMIAMYSVALEVGRLTALLSAFAVVFGFGLVGRLRHADLSVDGSEIAGTSGALLLAIILAEVRRNHRAAVQRAEAAERSREEEARLRATEERLRIARELHDVLAHQISLINVQAGAALHRRDPDQAFTALGDIKQASKETLRELRGVLGVLRQADEDAPVGPVPSLEALPDLIAQTKAAGMDVRLEGASDQPVAPPVDLTAYRIVQEALTNVVRHAGASEAVVSLGHESGQLIVEIADNGCAEPDPERMRLGNGLRGMRERAATVGGTVVAEPGPSGFRVRAELPVGGLGS